MKKSVKKYAVGGEAKYVPGAALARLQSKIDAANARRDAFRQANSVEARAAAQRAARAQGRSELDARATAARAPMGGSVAPSGGMGAAGRTTLGAKKGGVMKSGSASRRADGVAKKGKTRGKFV